MRGARFIGIGLIAALAGTAYLVETHGDFDRVHLVSFALAFFALAIATGIAPARLRSALLVLTSVALGLTLVEATASAMERKVDTTAGFDGGTRVPFIGWDNGPAGIFPHKRTNLQTGATIFDVAYTIDADGGRPVKSNATGRSVVFLGDSFTFGYGVDDGQTMPQQFADLLGGRQKVLNLAVSAYSPANILAQLQHGVQDRAIGKHPLAFVMMTGAFHVARSACKESWTIRAPRYEDVDGHVAYVGPCAAGSVAGFRRFLEQTAAYRVFIKPLRVRINHSDVETYIDIVAEVARTAKAKYGAEMLVPYIGGPVSAPKSLQHAQMKVLPIWAYLPGTGYDDDKIIAELRARGVNVIDMTLREEAMSGHRIGIPDDGHPTPFAQHRRAEMTLATLKTLGVPLAGATTQDAPKLSAVDQP